MKRNLMISLFSTLFFVSAMAAENAGTEIAVDADIAISSAFFWRGEIFSQENSFQPSITVNMGAARLNFWSTRDLQRKDDSSSRTRMDATLEYNRSAERYELTGGLGAYIYRDDTGGLSRDDTYEVYLGYGLNVPALPTLMVYYDFGELDALYASLGIGHQIAFGEADRVALSLTLQAGVADSKYREAIFSRPADEEQDLAAFSPDDPGLVDLTAKASLTLIPGDHFYITPSVKYMSLLDSKIRSALDARDEDTQEFAYTISFKFLF